MIEHVHVPAFRIDDVPQSARVASFTWTLRDSEFWFYVDF